VLPALILPALLAAQAPPPPPAVTTPAAPAVDPAVAELNQRIKALEAEQNWAEVIRTIEALGPEERDARLKAWTWALSNTGQHARVLAILDDPAHRERAKVDPLPQFKARALVALGRPKEGMAVFLGACKRGSVFAGIEGSNLAIEQGDWNAVLEFSDTILGLKPGDIVYLAKKGQALANLQRFAEGVPTLEEAVRRAPVLGESWADLACCYNGLGRFAEAHAAASRSLALHPGTLAALFNRGRASMGLRHFKEAREDYQAVLALNPGNPALVAYLQKEIKLADDSLGRP